MTVPLSSRVLVERNTQVFVAFLQDVVERSRQKSEMLQGFGDMVLWAEALEKELAKPRKHSTMLQSKLDGAFAQYHNEVQDMQAKSDELVRKNKSLCNKNKGMPLTCQVLIGITCSSLT
jgi:FtsZ-binding cell division protein ZapB